MTKEKVDFASFIDAGILPAVEILNEQGFETFESCQGGEGHCYEDPTVRFFGSEFDLIRAYETCRAFGLNVFEAKRVFRKADVYVDNNTPAVKSVGETWDKPFNELVFLIHSKTGTIFFPR